jgi:hypothetical protein
MGPTPTSCRSKARILLKLTVPNGVTGETWVRVTPVGVTHLLGVTNGVPNAPKSEEIPYGMDSLRSTVSCNGDESA